MLKVIEIKQNVFEDNNREADKLRAYLKENKTYLLNLMSSPGSGKTTTLKRVIEGLKNEMRIGVIEADIDSDIDARAVKEAGAKAVQVHTGGMCHLTADMTRQGLDALGIDDVDFCVLENVGNLVCPAEFDTGATKSAMILSVPEGDDKPLKYPLMFEVVDLVIVNKIDAAEFFDFSLELVTERIHKLNPGIEIISISAKTGEGVGKLLDWIRSEVKAHNS